MGDKPQSLKIMVSVGKVLHKCEAASKNRVLAQLEKIHMTLKLRHIGDVTTTTACLNIEQKMFVLIWAITWAIIDFCAMM